MGSSGSAVVSAGLRLLLADGNDDGRGGSDCIVKLLDSWSEHRTGTRHTAYRGTVVICEWTGTDQNVSCEEDADVLSLCDSAGKQTIEDFLYVGGGKVIPLTQSVTHSDIVMVSVPK